MAHPLFALRLPAYSLGFAAILITQFPGLPAMAADAVHPEIAAAKSSVSPAAKPPAERDLAVQDLASGDADRVRHAIGWVNDRARQVASERQGLLMLLVNAGHYDDAETLATHLMVNDSSDASLGRLQWVRVQSLIRQEQWQEALSGARVYFNCCSLRDSADALATIAALLQKLHPREPERVDAFKQQQVASANRGSPSAPSAILQISIPAEPFSSAADAISADDFRGQMKKANLLLLSGRAREAGELFAQAAADAPSERNHIDAQAGQARAARAESGYLGPANALIVQFNSNSAK